MFFSSRKSWQIYWNIGPTNGFSLINRRGTQACQVSEAAGKALAASRLLPRLVGEHQLFTSYESTYNPIDTVTVYNPLESH